MISKGALAIFVKTPGLSPVKTRLAASIGQPEADTFYGLSIKATQAIAQKLKQGLKDLEVYWSIAESDGIQAALWKEFRRIFQGDGTLGERLGCVYDQLLKSHGFVCFIGADSPHLTVGDLHKGIEKTAEKSSFVLGETVDGGFYFFGGSSPLPRKLWKSVEYSSDHTAKQLGGALEAFGQVHQLEKNFDIDTAEDLIAYRELCCSSFDFLPEQLDVIHWARGVGDNLASKN